MLKIGGRLVYSTCTFNPIEDEAVVAEVNAGNTMSCFNCSGRVTVSITPRHVSNISCVLFAEYLAQALAPSMCTLQLGECKASLFSGVNSTCGCTGVSCIHMLNVHYKPKATLLHCTV